MAEPTPANVSPWYLRNINQALALDTVSGNVYLRTGANFVGNVNVGNVGISSLGNVNISGNTMPISGNVNVTSGNITVQQGTSPWVVSGNVGITGNTSVTFPATGVDAFGRLRASNPYSLFDTAQRYYDHGQFDSAITGSASATVTYEANSSTFLCNVGTGGSDSVIRETKRVFPYQPGKSLLILMTVCMNAGKPNLRQRVGFFGAQNGIFFEQNGTTLNMVVRSYSSGAIVEDRIPQSSWNGDRLNGAGGATNPSGITLNAALDQIWFCDVEWLGVGNVRVGFVINGSYIVCHTFQHSNITGNTTTYMTTATLPLRYEITNTGVTASASTLRQICCSVISEGGYNAFGTTQIAGLGTTTKRLATGNVYYPIVSIRLASTRLDSIIVPRQVDVLSPTVNYYRWVLLQNPTLTGATWANTSQTGTVEYDLAATALTGGLEIQSGYASSRETVTLGSVDFFQYQLGRTLAGVSDIVTLALAATANNADVLAQLGWQELT